MPKVAGQEWLKTAHAPAGRSDVAGYFRVVRRGHESTMSNHGNHEDLSSDAAVVLFTPCSKDDVEQAQSNFANAPMRTRRHREHGIHTRRKRRDRNRSVPRCEQHLGSIGMCCGFSHGAALVPGRRRRHRCQPSAVVCADGHQAGTPQTVVRWTHLHTALRSWGRLPRATTIIR